jgi:hypothetical protein
MNQFLFYKNHQVSPFVCGQVVNPAKMWINPMAIGAF